MNPTRSRRSGFTLVELLVVMAIIVTLAALALLVAPRFETQAKAGNGAQQLQQMLLIAKQQATRDRVPTGVRLQQLPTGEFAELVYIQQPEDFAQGRLIPNPGTNTSAAALLQAFFVGFSLAASDTGMGGNNNYQVMVGDYLEVNGSGQIYAITGIAQPGPTTGQATLKAPLILNLDRPLVSVPPPLPPPPTTGTAPPLPPPNYRIIRQPRVMQGEEPVLLPRDVGVDIVLSQNLPNRPDPATNATIVEVLFSPSGGVLRATSNAPIIFYVRDMTAGTFENEPVLITVNPRTGKIAAYPVDPNDPYSITKDPRSSGM